MSIVIPAILPKSRADLDTQLARFEGIAGVTHIQIDIVDGIFAKPPTWPYANQHEEWELPKAERFRFDMDLMVEAPGATLSQWVQAGAARLTIHAESTPNLAHTIADAKRDFGYAAGFTPALLSLGVALNIDTDLGAIASCIADIDYVQCMGIAHIGRQGEPFDARVLTKVRALRAKHPDLTIQIDGGVSLATAPLLLAAGATRLVVGSALMHTDDVAAEIAKFEALGEKYGVFPGA